jgi:hypothetical protein
MTVPVKAGELLHLAEPDQDSDGGNLVIRVTAVAACSANSDWINLRGIEIGWNGERLTEHEIRVRVSALRGPRCRDIP